MKKFAMIGFLILLMGVVGTVYAQSIPRDWPDVEYQMYFKANGISQENVVKVQDILQKAVNDIKTGVTGSEVSIEFFQADRFQRQVSFE